MSRVNASLSNKTSPVLSAALPMMVVVLSFWTPLCYWLLHYSVSHSETRVEALPWRLFAHTFLLAAGTALLAVLAAYPVAILAWLFQGRAARMLSLMMLLPVLVGLLARNYSWIGMLSQTKSSTTLRWLLPGISLYGTTAVYAVMFYIFLPIAFFIVRQGFNAVRSGQIEAGRSLGATESELLWRVVLPQTRRQAITAMVFIFGNALGYFVTPRMIGGGNYDMVGNAIWQYTNKLAAFNEASYIALLLLGCCVPVYLFAYFQILKSRQRVLGR